MMDPYSTHMFGAASRDLQAGDGLKERFEKMYRNRFTGGLDERARTFIETRSSFYMASLVDTGWPYIQHRGGPVGFLKVLDEATIGFADYHGNQQYITQGNVATEDRVSLILMDYPARARLKLIGHATIIPAQVDADLAARLAVPGEGPVERLVTIRLAAMDWNCPKYITPRFSEAEIEQMLAPKMAEINRQVGVLADRLAELGEDPAALLQPKDQT